jgi:hypothetical protein
MSSSLKDALLKVGLKGTKSQNERPKKRVKDKQKVEKFQEQRNFCEHCSAIWPDVEKYNHRKPHIEANWLCSKCADENQISDETRITNQSDFAKNNTFRREFGMTKKFTKEGSSMTPHQKRPRNADGNKGPRKKSPYRK